MICVVTYNQGEGRQMVYHSWGKYLQSHNCTTVHFILCEEADYKDRRKPKSKWSFLQLFVWTITDNEKVM